MNKQEMKELTGKEKKVQRRKNKEGLTSIYVMVQNVRNGYTKLCTRQKANEMVNGKFDYVTMTLKKNLKDEYRII